MDDLPVGWMMTLGRVQVRAVCVVMQMMIRIALTALLTASHTANANGAKIKNYENHIALRYHRGD
ncbi:MAG: hypothetical protein ABR75_08350 [Acidimicrobiia bacterium BACL6 MAG-120924-bin43]|uniref:Uncharacterized protein n=1 Tax=Acidimicrobiia bacterium BACL6 MAG-120924-bin43 TaxID=1655583 RepID=A0A0R2QH16_9ACTN|nr:MAG: hypothetical protein ABR75_08350 [Acidimicrobiia bacterium BACL6 MAG-120924-bin43]